MLVTVEALKEVSANCNWLVEKAKAIKKSNTQMTPLFLCEISIPLTIHLLSFTSLKISQACKLTLKNCRIVSRPLFSVQPTPIFARPESEKSFEGMEKPKETLAMQAMQKVSNQTPTFVFVPKLKSFA